jgi:small-conductance mechanosensitive channel
MVDASSISLGGMFGGIGGFNLGAIGNVLLIFFIAILIFGLLGVGIFMYINNKKYKYKVPLLRTVGNSVIRVGTYKAKDYKIGNAGDKLWYVRGVKKYIPPATVQTAPNEYTHFEREDGEWINIGLPNIDERLKELGVKYVHQDMRANRIAISNLLEQRFTKKSFWDKYGNMIMNVVFYLVVAIAMVIIFYQWSGIVDKTGALIGQIQQLMEEANSNNPNAIIPAIVPLFLLSWRSKKRWHLFKH